MPRSIQFYPSTGPVLRRAFPSLSRPPRRASISFRGWRSARSTTPVWARSTVCCRRASKRTLCTLRWIGPHRSSTLTSGSATAGSARVNAGSPKRLSACSGSAPANTRERRLENAALGIAVWSFDQLGGEQQSRVDGCRGRFDGRLDHVERPGQHEVALSADAAGKVKPAQSNLGALERRVGREQRRRRRLRLHNAKAAAPALIPLVPQAAEQRRRWPRKEKLVEQARARRLHSRLERLLGFPHAPAEKQNVLSGRDGIGHRQLDLSALDQRVADQHSARDRLDLQQRERRAGDVHALDDPEVVFERAPP